ncbi:MAG: NADPH-dependent FMN reductase [Phycisphaerales bacterium]
MSYLVISCSLNPESRSRTLARNALEAFKGRGQTAEFVDLVTLGLPMCDGGAAYSHPTVSPLAAKVASANGVLLAFPIYNYSAAATCKNLIELTGKAWTGKVVGLMAAAGGANSFMAPMQIAGSLMLDFRSIVLPRYVYAAGEAVSAAAVVDSEVARRIDELVGELIRVATALTPKG